MAGGLQNNCVCVQVKMLLQQPSEVTTKIAEATAVHFGLQRTTTLIMLMWDKSTNIIHSESRKSAERMSELRIATLPKNEKSQDLRSTCCQHCRFSEDALG